MKVLDFGLAKAFQTDASGPNVSMSPTISLTAAATQMGMVIGTAAYMAPEQAKGKVVDKRADVWAFGAVVYEMLTGERAFVGDDVSDTLAAVLRAEGNLDRLADETPARFRQVLRACLQRDPKQRLQAIGDVRLAMEGAFETTVTVPSDAAAAPQLQVWHRPMFAAVAAVGLVVVTGLAVWSAPRGSEPVVRPLRRFAIDLGPALPIAVSNVRAMPTVSLDGTQLVYAANIIGTQKLYLRTFGQLDAQPITGIENAYEPFFSPDGEWVGFLDSIFRVLKRVSVRGGPALTLSDCYPLAGATWFPDGTIVFAHDEGGAGTTLFRIPEAGATLEPLTKVDAENGEVAHYWPRMLPGGTALLFTIASDLARAYASRVAVLSLDSGEYHTVVNGGYNGRYVPIGHLVFGRQGALWGVPFDVDRLVATGQEEVVLQEVELNEQYGSMALSVSADSSLVYMGNELRGGGRRVRLGRPRRRRGAGPAPVAPVSRPQRLSRRKPPGGERRRYRDRRGGHLGVRPHDRRRAPSHTGGR